MTAATCRVAESVATSLVAPPVVRATLSWILSVAATVAVVPGARAARPLAADVAGKQAGGGAVGAVEQRHGVAGLVGDLAAEAEAEARDRSCLPDGRQAGRAARALAGGRERRVVRRGGRSAPGHRPRARDRRAPECPERPAGARRRPAPVRDGRNAGAQVGRVDAGDVCVAENGRGRGQGERCHRCGTRAAGEEVERVGLGRGRAARAPVGRLDDRAGHLLGADDRPAGASCPTGR